MADVKLTDIVKTYDNGVDAVRGINLEIADQEFVILVGPSGCGKSTTLRMIAGLEDVTSGELSIGGRRVNGIASKDRDIAMVFQNYALYPHMTVFDNIAFSLKLRKVPKPEIRQRVLEAARILDIEDILDRKPKAISGGQKQRVAMGRAIVRAPQVFLMDEPLSNLDAKLRVQMRMEIARLHKTLQTTFIYVTHDQTEAMTLGQRIVVMKDGIIMQTGTPSELYNRPANLFVAGFIGSPQMNFIEATVESEDSISFDRFSIHLPDWRHVLSSYVGKKIIAGIRPEDVKIGDGTDAHVEMVELHGADTMLYLDWNGKPLTARTTSGIEVGCAVGIDLDASKLHLFDAETECSLGYL